MAEETVGCGVTLMQDQAQPDDPEPRKDEEEIHKRSRRTSSTGAQFRRRNRLQGQFPALRRPSTPARVAKS
jgi:hypothetical protein